MLYTRHEAEWLAKLANMPSSHQWLNSSMATYIAMFASGANWIQGQSSRAQPFWAEHASFMDALFDSGRIIMAGPLADYSGIIVILEANSSSEVREMFSQDPFVENRITVLESVLEWLIFLDVRRG